MWRLIILAVIQCMILSSGQVFLKFALQRMEGFGWTWTFWRSVLLNWQLAGCGLCYLTGSILWMYILKHFPFSMAYPMISLSYVFGMFAAMFFFHEDIPVTRWIGVFLIITGTVFIAR